MNRMMKLQNILFPKQELQEHWWMFYRGSRIRHDVLESAYCLKAEEQAEFFTYFNAFSLEKWKRYTSIDRVFLCLSAKGRFGIQLFGHYMNGSVIEKEILSENYWEMEDRKTVSISIPMDAKSQVVSFQIFAYDETAIYEGCYMAEIDSKNRNEVNLSLVTVTFRKEDFIARNLRLLENEIIYSEEEVSGHIFVRVIDNGGTLDENEWNSEHIYIYKNPNAGGSGGYSRGMIETLRDERFPATHALLMDDDVKILPESIIRTYNLLRCLKPKYRDHFISGAMLYYERMHVQHEDVGFIDKNGTYGPRKPVMEMHLPQSVIRNEQIYKDEPNNYAGWWYCCIPRTKLSLDRLALPLFVRGDDVEFSISNHAQFITMNGICIWHMGFENKFNMPMEFYQVHRNSLIIQATSDVATEIDYKKRITTIFRTELNRFNYIGCDFLLDSIEDYLKGPEFIKEPKGEAIMREHALQVKKMLAVEGSYPEIDVDYSQIYRRAGELKGWKRFLYQKTYNGHLLPTFMLKRSPGVVAYDWFDAPEKQYLRESVLAVNPHDRTGILRYRSRREFLRLMKRYRALMKRYERCKDSVREEYKEAKSELTGVKFWQEYLN